MWGLSGGNLIKTGIEVLWAFVGGFLISYVCFGMIPFAFSKRGEGIWFVIGGMLLGVILYSIFETKQKPLDIKQLSGLTGDLMIYIALGVIIGVAINHFVSIFYYLIIGLASGVIINAACGKILPKTCGSNRIFTIVSFVFSSFGLIAGVLLTV